MILKILNLTSLIPKNIYITFITVYKQHQIKSAKYSNKNKKQDMFKNKIKSCSFTQSACRAKTYYELK